MAQFVKGTFIHTSKQTQKKMYVGRDFENICPLAILGDPWL